MARLSPAPNKRRAPEDLAMDIGAEVIASIHSLVGRAFEYTDDEGRMDADLQQALCDELGFRSDELQGVAEEVAAIPTRDVPDAACDAEGSRRRTVNVARRVWDHGPYDRSDYAGMVASARKKSAGTPTPEEAAALDRAAEAGYLTPDPDSGEALWDYWTVRCVVAGRPMIAVTTPRRVDGLLTARVAFQPDPGLLFDEGRGDEAAALGVRVAEMFEAAGGGVTKLPNMLMTGTLPAEGAVAIAERLVEIVAEVGHEDPPGSPSPA